MEDETNSDVDHKIIHNKTSGHLKNAENSETVINLKDKLATEQHNKLATEHHNKLATEQHNKLATEKHNKLATEKHNKLFTEQHNNVSRTSLSDIDIVQEVEVAKAPDGGLGWFIILGGLLLRTTISRYTS